MEKTTFDIWMVLVCGRSNFLSTILTPQTKTKSKGVFNNCLGLATPADCALKIECAWRDYQKTCRERCKFKL